MSTPPARLTVMPSQKEPATVFGARLIAARRARGLTQVQLAEAIGSTQRAISYYEATGGNATVDAVIKLAKALDTTSDNLLGITPESTEQPEPETADERRLWRRFRQLVALPEKDRRAIFRTLDSMAKAQQATTTTAKAG